MTDRPLTWAALVAGLTPDVVLEVGQALAEGITRPAWHAAAACRRPEHAAVNFYPQRGEDARPAKAVCATCTVRQPCLADALARSDTHGIWGGLSERERRRLRAQRAPIRQDPADRRARVLELRQAGLSHRAIAEELGVGQRTVAVDLRLLARETADRHPS